MPYKIVKTFEKGNSRLSVVPSNWEKDGVLHWPRYNENKLRRQENSCPENNWRKINCKVKRSNLNNFLEAEHELDKMCKKSDTETDNEQYNSNYVPNQKDITFEEIVQDCIRYENILPACDNNKRAVEPVVFNDSNAQQNATTEDQADNAVFNDSTRQNETTEVQIDNASLTLMVLEKKDILQENYKTVNDKLSEIIKAQNDDRKLISDSVESILLGLSNISVQFERMTNQFSPTESDKQKPNIQPIASETDLDNLEKILENAEIEEELRKKYSIICGKGKGRGINNAYALVDAMFSRCFLLQCSWAGGSRTTEQKICFKSYTKIINFFFNIIYESDSTYTLIDCHNFFKNILKNARQRNESKQERTSRTKNRPKIKGKRKTEQPSLPITGSSSPENEDPMSSVSVARMHIEPLETSV